MTLGEKIKMYRSQNGLSQEKIAELVGVSRQAVTKWESGQSAPSTANLITLAEIFKISMDDLVSGVSQTGLAERKQGMAKLVAAIILAAAGVFSIVIISNMNAINIMNTFGVDVFSVNTIRLSFQLGGGMAIIAAIVLFVLYIKGLKK